MTFPAGPPPGSQGSQPGLPAVCVRHPDRPTGLTCTRCGRPACPECLRDASVGQQCVDCVSQGARTVRRGTTVAGAELGSRAVVVPALIAVNLLAFAVTALQAGSLMQNTRSELFYATALTPGTVALGDWWRVLSSGFMHIGLLHIAFNMFALWVIGRDLELVLGRVRFLAVYGLGILGGSAAVMLTYPPDGAVAGASGAVFGLMGGLLVVLLRLRRPPGQVLGILAINLALGFFVGGISWQAHIGGLVIGAAATAVLVFAPRGPRQTAVQTGGLVGLLVLTLVLIGVPAAALLGMI